SRGDLVLVPVEEDDERTRSRRNRTSLGDEDDGAVRAVLRLRRTRRLDRGHADTVRIAAPAVRARRDRRRNRGRSAEVEGDAAKQRVRAEPRLGFLTAEV